MKQIVVMQRGWVYAGDVRQEGDEFVLEPAACVHRWGTTRGLAEIQKGPTESTELHHCSHPVRVHYLAVVHRLDCDEEAWTEALNA